MKKKVAFHWNVVEESSFRDLIFALTNALLLALPDYGAPFAICTDAFGLGLGAIFMQCDERGKNHVIAYASRVLMQPSQITLLPTLKP